MISKSGIKIKPSCPHCAKNRGQNCKFMSCLIKIWNLRVDNLKENRILGIYRKSEYKSFGCLYKKIVFKDICYENVTPCSSRLTNFFCQILTLNHVKMKTCFRVLKIEKSDGLVLLLITFLL